MPLNPWSELSSEFLIRMIKSGHQWAFDSGPTHPITALNCVYLLHVLFRHTCWEVLLVFQCGVVELFSRSVFDLCCKEDCHLLEVIGQLLSSNNILEFLDTVLQVIGIRGSVFIIFPEQLSASNESDCILNEFCLDFRLVRVLMQFNEAFIDLCAYPQCDYSYGVVKEFKGFIFRLLDRVRFKDFWSTFYVSLCKSNRLAVNLLYEFRWLGIGWTSLGRSLYNQPSVHV